MIHVLGEFLFGPLPPSPRLRLSPDEVRAVHDRSDLRAWLHTLVRYSDDLLHDLLVLSRWHAAWEIRYQHVLAWNTRCMCVFGLLALPMLLRGEWVATLLGLVTLLLMRWDIRRMQRDTRTRAEVFRSGREHVRGEVELACAVMDRHPDGIPDAVIEELWLKVESWRQWRAVNAPEASAAAPAGPASTPT